MTNKEAIAILKYIYFKCDKDQGEHIALDMAIKALEDRPQGEWIDGDSYYANCSWCAYQIDTHYHRGYLNFCPNCGADMRGGRE